VQKYMEKLAGQQEIIAMISDIIIEIFAMESALLRALKKCRRRGGKIRDPDRRHAGVHQRRLCQGRISCKQIFASLSEGESLEPS